ncbi:CC70B protein, partial [Atractosteus spatula]|nr:CC70B protein [Atractosteus spatula]
MTASGSQKVPKSDKLDEAQALAKSCAGRPDFLPCDGLSICATHSHGKCFKLHWCCHLGWCHCSINVFLLYHYTIESKIHQNGTKDQDSSENITFCGDQRRICLLLFVLLNFHHFCSIYSIRSWIPLYLYFFSPCKYVYQPMTNVGQLPSTPVPAAPSDYTNTINLSVSLTERFLKTAPCFQPPPCPESPKYCLISELFIDDYQVKRINGKMCYVQRPSPQASGPKMDHCSSPSSSEDSGINALGLHYLESCDEDTEDEEEEEDDELSTDEDSSPGSIWDQDECTLLSPSKSTVEIIEKIETTV